MLKRVLLSTIFATSLLAGALNINDTVTPLSLPDQFDKIHTIESKIKTLVISFEKGTSTDVNTFLSSQQSDFLQEHQAVFIADISAMPSLAAKLFALPKMRTYKYKILLIRDENDKRFIKKDGKLTVYKMDNGKIKEISFISSVEELKKVFE